MGIAVLIFRRLPAVVLTYRLIPRIEDLREAIFSGWAISHRTLQMNSVLTLKLGFLGRLEWVQYSTYMFVLRQWKILESQKRQSM